jgi:hypothetical protein
MRRTTTLVLVFGMVTTLAAAAEAMTPRRVCRQACAPRIDEQCTGLRGRAFRQCRRSLVRACRQTTPAVACTTTAEMLDLLADHAFRVPASAAGRQAALALCANQRFSREEFSDQSVDDLSAGSWAVVIAEGALEIDLQVEPSGNQRLTVARGDGGAISVDGDPVDLLDATATCAAGAGGGPDAARPREVEDLIANKSLRVDFTRTVTGGTITDRHDMTLCGTGGVRLQVTQITSGVFGNGRIDDFEGTWSVQLDRDGVFLQLELDDTTAGTTETRRFALEVGDDGSISIEGNPATLSDASQACGVLSPAEQADRELSGRLKGALRDRVLVTVRTNGTGGQRTSVLVLCTSGHFGLEVTDSGPPVAAQTTTGRFSVRVENGAATLSLDPDSTAGTIEFSVGLDDAGNVLLNGAPASVGDTGLVAQTCN